MKKILKTWLMETKDGRGVYKDLRGRVTLEADSNMRCEFIEGQRHGDKRNFSKKRPATFWMSNVSGNVVRTGPRRLSHDRETPFEKQ